MNREELLERLRQQRIEPSTYINIARQLVDNRKNIRTPGVRGEPLIRELNIRIGETEEIINRLDIQAEQLLGTRNIRSSGVLQQIYDDRDKLRIELEFYKDLMKPYRRNRRDYLKKSY